MSWEPYLVGRLIVYRIKAYVGLVDLLATAGIEKRKKKKEKTPQGLGNKNSRKPNLNIAIMNPYVLDLEYYRREDMTICLRQGLRHRPAEGHYA